MRVKICGIRDQRGLEAAIRWGADAVGFITEVPVDTPRRVSLERAANLIQAVPVFVTPVMVIMPEGPGEATELVEKGNPPVVQIHNKPNPRVLEALKPRVKVIQTIQVRPESQPQEILETLEEIEGLVDAVLLDTFTPRGGGTGRVHNWQTSREVVKKTDIPVILAGGLTPRNVKQAIEHVRPYAVDTASGVESQPGIKSEERIREFIQAAKTSNPNPAPL